MGFEDGSETITGDFKIDGNDLIIEESLLVDTVIGYKYDAENDTLTLTYSDGVEVYTRAN